MKRYGFIGETKSTELWLKWNTRSMYGVRGVGVGVVAGACEGSGSFSYLQVNKLACDL